MKDVHDNIRVPHSSAHDDRLKEFAGQVGVNPKLVDEANQTFRGCLRILPRDIQSNPYRNTVRYATHSKNN